MNIQKRLDAYTSNVLESGCLEEKIWALRDKATYAAPPVEGTKVQRTPTPDPMASLVAMYIDQTQKLNRRLIELFNERSELESLIASLPPKLEKIIKLRYIQGYSWDHVIDEVNYSRSHVLRLHLIALEEMEKKDGTKWDY